jgi:hypothetical protein
VDASDIIVLDGLAMTSWRNVFISVWRGRSSVALLQALREESTRYKQRFPAGNSSITVLENVAAMKLTPEERAEANALATWGEGTTLSVAHVVLGSSFGVAAARMVLAGMMKLSRRRYPNKTFEAIAPAVTWTLGHALPAVEHADAQPHIERTIAAARARLG